MMDVRRLILAAGCIVSPIVAAAQGLRFAGLERPIDERTSYNVFSGSVPSFRDSLDISFDMKTYPESRIGYIFRIKERSEGKVYNLFYDAQGDRLVFKLNREGYSTLVDAEVPFPQSEWFGLRVMFDMERDSVLFSVDDSVFVAAADDLPDRFCPEIDFGRSEYVVDVPSFAIRNLAIGGVAKRFFFPLGEREGGRVYDDRGRRRGEVSNPEWLMNEYFQWRHIATMKMDSVACAGYIPKFRSVYYFDRSSVSFCDIRTGAVTSVPFSNHCPVRLTLGTSFQDPVHSRIYAYEVWYEDGRMRDSSSVAVLDLGRMRWRSHSREQLGMQMHHHGAFFDANKGRYTIFGGFGNMHYNGSFYSYDLDSRHWYAYPAVADSVICPRYFTSLGYEKETGSIYLYGGMGNISGEQAVGRRYLYEFFRVDAETGDTERLWKSRPAERNTVPVRSLILSGDGYFYTLCYPESYTDSHLQLYRFSVKDGTAEPVADRIPIHSDKITTNANIYYDREEEKMIATVQEFDDDISSTLDIYTLPLLPVSDEASAAYFAALGREPRTGRSLLILAGVAVMLVATGGATVYMVRRGRRRRLPASARWPVAEPHTRNALYLFGPFEVRDSDGRDMTAAFTGQQIQLLCLILYYTMSGNGISSRRLSSYLWPDKSEEKVKNSRNVAINHLRKSLSGLESAGIVHENGCYRFDYGNGLWCDYIRFERIMSSDNPSGDVDELLAILARGKFLAFADDPLFDGFKESVERRIEPFLSSEIENRFLAKDYGKVAEIAEMLFRIDPVNEIAIAMLVKALVKQRHHEDARIRYRSFCEVWRSAYETDYHITFDTLCSDARTVRK